MIRHHVRSFGSNKILAIKLVRELTGLGLKDSKDAVEQQIGFLVTADARVLARVSDEARRSGIEFDPLLDGSSAATGSASALDSGHFGAGGHHSVRYCSGPKKIHAIKLVREITGLGLKDAKDLVEDGGMIRTGITRAEADAIAARFLEFGSQVEVRESGSGSGSGSGYGFEPEDDDDF